MDNTTTISSMMAATLDSAALPDRIKILNWGNNPSSQGVFVVDDSTVESLAAQLAGPFAHIVIDFDHQSEPSAPLYKPSPRHHAASRATVEAVPGDGVYLSAIDWTPYGREHARDYCDVSPVLQHGKDRVVRGIKSVALVSNGALEKAAIFSASFETHPEEKNMEQNPETPAPNELESKLADITEKLAKLTQQVEDLTAATTKADDEAKAAAEAASQKTEAQLAALTAGMDAAEKNQMIQMAVLQGKAVTLSDEALAKLSAKEVADHISALKVTLPVSRVTPTGDATDEAQTSNLAAKQMAAVEECRKSTGLSFLRAWDVCAREKPELFRN